LDQTHYNRTQAKDDTMTAELKMNRPIEEKESNRWLVMLEEASQQAVHVKPLPIVNRRGAADGGSIAAGDAR
jgi:hypothetical protein